jgi:hypothetical protein
MRLSVRGFAGYLGVAVRTVAGWEAGGTGIVPRPEMQAALDTALQRAGQDASDRFRQLLVERADWHPDAGPSGRSPATAAGGGGGGAAGAPQPWLPAQRQPPVGNEVCVSAIRSFRAADRQVGGRHLYATVISYLHREVAPQLFHPVAGGDGQGIFTAAAALTDMAGWMAHDAGNDHAAWQHFTRSLDLAQVGGDRQLTAHVLASLSYLAHHLAQPGRAVALAQRGQQTLRDRPRQPEVDARLLALHARGVAARRDARECTRLLQQAEQALQQTPGEPRSPWASRFDEAALAHETARCLYQLGDLAAAGRQAERVIALRGGDRTRSRALGQLILVSVLVSQGRYEQAGALAREVIDTTRHLGSYLVLRQLLGLRQRLAPQQSHPAAAAFLGCVQDALRERRWLSPDQPPGTQPQPAGTTIGLV